MWTFINEMTHVQPECRPTLAEVVARLERLKIELDSEQVSSEAPDETELAVQEVTEAGEETAAEALHLPPNRSSAQAAPSKGILKPSLQVGPIHMCNCNWSIDPLWITRNLRETQQSPSGTSSLQHTLPSGKSNLGCSRPQVESGFRDATTSYGI